MRGTMPTVHCDDESGCTEWTVDWYTATADNWRALMAGWEYDPYRSGRNIFCPEHAAMGGGERG